MGYSLGTGNERNEALLQVSKKYIYFTIMNTFFTLPPRFGNKISEGTMNKEVAVK